MTQKTNCCLKWRVEPSHPNGEEKAPALLYALISFFAIFAFFAAKILRRGVIQQESKLNHPSGESSLGIWSTDKL